MMRRVLGLSLFFLLSCWPVQGQQDFFPFLAEVTSDQVNVRAGQSVNFEKVCVLEKGEKVLVMDKSFSWYKIQLPLKAKSYIITKYVLLSDPRQGEITANRVNIRAGADVHRTVLGQLNEGDVVQILGTEGDWFQILPRERSYGWVAEEYLSFVSRDIEPYHEKMTQARVERISPEEETPVSDEPKHVASQPLEKEDAQEPRGSGEDSGSRECFIRKKERDSQGAPRYICVQDDQTVFSLSAWEGVLQKFEGFKVKLEGKMDPARAGELFSPGFHVNRIELIL